jgi:hypothetical protein
MQRSNKNRFLWWRQLVSWILKVALNHAIMIRTFLSSPIALRPEGIAGSDEENETRSETALNAVDLVVKFKII